MTTVLSLIGLTIAASAIFYLRDKRRKEQEEAQRGIDRTLVSDLINRLRWAAGQDRVVLKSNENAAEMAKTVYGLCKKYGWKQSEFRVNTDDKSERIELGLWVELIGQAPIRQLAEAKRIMSLQRTLKVKPANDTEDETGVQLVGMDAMADRRTRNHENQERQNANSFARSKRAAHG
ncbi:MAG: hypothetical protein RLZZ324_79 [Candidatus Parcubacteria bacterium]|jgi:hypothetical protein